MPAIKHLVPKPNSRFVSIECESCDSQSIIFTMTKSTINCKFCGNVLAKATGGKAFIFGKLVKIKDDSLPGIPINTVQKDSGKNITKLLIDTMIIHKLINGQSIYKIVPGISRYTINLIVLDRILIETIHMEKQEYNVQITTQDIIKKLQKIGTVTSMNIDHASKDMIKARELSDSKKYVNDKGIPLSMTDCILLQTYLKLQDVKLVTFDKTLRNAANIEKVSVDGLFG